MRRVSRIIAAGLFTAAAAGAFGQTASLEQAADQCAAYFAKSAAAGKRIAVPHINAATEQISEYITDALVMRFVNNGAFTVVERNRDRSKAADDELEYQLSPFVSDATALSITAQLGAQVVITGTLAKRGGVYRLTASAVDVETRQTLGQWQSGDIRPDAALLRADKRPALLVFDGTVLSSADKRALLQGVQKGLQAASAPFTVNTGGTAAGGGSPWEILVFVDYETTESRCIGTVSAALVKDGMVLLQGEDISITETTPRWFITAAANRLQNDTQFFTGLAAVVE